MSAISKTAYKDTHVKLAQLLLFGVGSLNHTALTESINTGDFSIKRYAQATLLQSDWLLYEIILKQLKEDGASNIVINTTMIKLRAELNKKEGSGTRLRIENNLKKLADTFFICSKGSAELISGSLVEQFSFSESGEISIIVRPDIAKFWSSIEWTEFSTRVAIAKQSELASWLYMYFVFSGNTLSPPLNRVSRLCQFKSYYEKVFIELLTKAIAIVKNEAGVTIEIAINKSDEKVLFRDPAKS